MGRVLVVDDDMMTLQHCHTILTASQRDKYEVILSMDPLDAFKSLSNHPIDLVITDLMMPKVNGYTFLSAARELPDFHVPIIMLSGRRDLDSVRRAISLGATDYILKPIDPDIFLSKVNSALHPESALSPNLANVKLSVDRNAYVELPRTCAVIRNISEAGMLIGFESPIDPDLQIRLDTALFREIGIDPPEVKFSKFQRNDLVKDFIYESFVRFVGLDEESSQKIRKWISNKAVNQKK